MKAATLGLVFGALVANTQFLEDEDSLMQEEWEDFDDNRELQDIDSLLEEGEEGGTTVAEFEEPDIDDLQEAEEGEGED